MSNTMRIPATAIVTCLLSSSMMGQTTAGDSTASAAEKELTRITRELFDALPSGNKSVWEQYVADDVIYTDENFRVMTKKELLDDISPLPKGYTGTIRLADIRSRIQGDAAVLSYRILEEEYVFGQKLSPVYLATNVYLRRNDRWQMVAAHVTVRPGERKVVPTTFEQKKTLVGEYELSPGVTYTVTIENDTLVGRRAGRMKEQLLPADQNTFFVKGRLRGEKVFTRDVQGKTIEMLDRRENTDLIWKRVR